MKEKLCERCKKAIEPARLKAMPNARCCAKCLGLNPDPMANDIEISDIPEDIKSKLMGRLADLNRKEKNFDKEIQAHKDRIEKKIKEQFRREEEELIGKKYQIENENTQLLSTIEDLTNKLNNCVLNNDMAQLKNNEILLYINKDRKTDRSPLLVGKAIINNNVYDVVIWKNIDDKGKIYWSGWLNDPNGYMDGKTSKRYISFRKNTNKNSLSGQIRLDVVPYNIEMNVYEYQTTHLKYIKGKISQTDSVVPPISKL